MMMCGTIFPMCKNELSPRGRTSLPAAVFSEGQDQPSQGQWKAGLAQHRIGPMTPMLTQIPTAAGLQIKTGPSRAAQSGCHHGPVAAQATQINRAPMAACPPDIPQASQVASPAPTIHRAFGGHWSHWHDTTPQLLQIHRSRHSPRQQPITVHIHSSRWQNLDFHLIMHIFCDQQCSPMWSTSVQTSFKRNILISSDASWGGGYRNSLIHPNF